MKAIILAGGKGTRLAPYTTVFPKPLVPLGNLPIIDIIIRQLMYYGLNDIVLTLGYLAELIQAYFSTNTFFSHSGKITYIREHKPTGTAGSLSMVPDLNDTFLVMNGDILTSLDYSKLIDYHNEKGGILTIAMHMKKVQIDLGVMEVDKENVLQGYIEKPEKIYPVSMGIYVYEPSVLKYIEPNKYLDFPNLVINLLKNGEKVVGYHCNDFWMDIGQREDYIKAQEKFEIMKNKFLPGD